MKFIHIHIGKCAGGSINIALNKNGIRFTELHCGAANVQLEHEISNDDGENFYLISLRDPIKRFVSSFNFDKYEKIISGNCKNSGWRRIYENFDSANELAEGLLSSDQDVRDLAHYALNKSKLHMHMGLSWYVPIFMVKKLPLNRVHIIRTENLDNDFNEFLKRFGKENVLTKMPSDKKSENFLEKIDVKNPKKLSNKSIAILTAFLLDDYYVLDHFFESGLLDSPYKRLI
ncbi:hypothetical protein ACJJI3_12320 [Microbulbifer sp. ZKSA004]|uniref:hypothetical protein n=1 Tax=Microbulbifer sp. ZKSA004 TaxID=3243389 RepID=UPI00403A35A0